MPATYKPKPPQDETDALRDSITHRVQVGDDVRVSIGGMRQTTIRCVSKGSGGITGEDENGKRFKIYWEHVIGLAGKKPTEKKVLLNVKRKDGNNAN